MTRGLLATSAPSCRCSLGRVALASTVCLAGRALRTWTPQSYSLSLRRSSATSCSRSGGHGSNGDRRKGSKVQRGHVGVGARGAGVTRVSNARPVNGERFGAGPDAVPVVGDTAGRGPRRPLPCSGRNHEELRGRAQGGRRAPGELRTAGEGEALAGPPGDGDVVTGRVRAPARPPGGRSAGQKCAGGAPCGLRTRRVLPDMDTAPSRGGLARDLPCRGVSTRTAFLKGGLRRGGGGRPEVHLSPAGDQGWDQQPGEEGEARVQGEGQPLVKAQMVGRCSVTGVPVSQDRGCQGHRGQLSVAAAQEFLV